MKTASDRAAREASQWTQPLQAAVAAFFVVSAAVNSLIVFGFGDLYRQYYGRFYQRAGLPADQLVASVEGSMMVISVITAGLAVAYLLLAALSYFRRSGWIFIVDMVFLFLAGAPNLLGSVLNLVSPSSASLPQAFGLTQLVLSVVALSLFILMLGLSLRYGPWAQQPAAARAVE